MISKVLSNDTDERKSCASSTNEIFYLQSKTLLGGSSETGMVHSDPKQVMSE